MGKAMSEMQLAMSEVERNWRSNWRFEKFRLNRLIWLSRLKESSRCCLLLACKAFEPSSLSGCCCNLLFALLFLLRLRSRPTLG